MSDDDKDLGEEEAQAAVYELLKEVRDYLDDEATSRRGQKLQGKIEFALGNYFEEDDEDEDDEDEDDEDEDEDDEDEDEDDDEDDEDDEDDDEDDDEESEEEESEEEEPGED